ncbi:MAG: nucleotidyltransferase domain-containing protein, partial [Blautia sp.]|nr:nucleotidyltransferase domain-containing protein [Blautia sp.]
SESDVDIMILLDLTDMDIKKYRHQLSDLTFDFNMEHDVDIKPIAKSEAQYHKWMLSYPFYSNINRDGVKLYAAS